MESSRNKKRGVEQNDITDSKRPKLASVVVEAMKVDSLQRLCSSLEPLFRRIVSEEVERALTRFNHSRLPERSTPSRIQPKGGRNLRIEFKTRMPPHLFTGGKVEGEQGTAIHVVLVDNNTGLVVNNGPESCLKLDVVVLEGDFSDEAEGDWSKEQFESHVVKARKGKRPLLTGDLHVVLNEGIGTLGELSFTDNSSWIRSRKFRLGVKVAPEISDGVYVREGKTDAFAVKDHRGELYKKHYPPALHDEVWRLDRIAKDGALHKKLVRADIATVEDFLRILVRDPQKLRNILGSAMSNKMWENTVEHAKTCVLGGKLYVYYADESRTTAVVFDQIYELRGFLADGQFHSLESLNHVQKISVDCLVKRAYENWNRVIEYDGKVLTALSDTNNKNTTCKSLLPSPSDPPITPNPHLNYHPHPQQFGTLFPDTSSYLPIAPHGNPNYVPQYCNSETRDGNVILGDYFAEEIRVRSSEMLQNEDMQRLLRSFTMGGGGGVDQDVCYADQESCNFSYESRRKGRISRGGSGKAVVGWLKLKAALRWGIFIRKQAAVRRRAQLVELDY